MIELGDKSIKDIFEDIGTLVEVEGNSPLIMTDENSIYYVKNGYVDLFSISIEGGEIKDKRNYLFRLSEGQVIFGFHHKDALKAIGLLITGISGTQLIKVSKSNLIHYLHTSENTYFIEKPLEEWISLWSGSLETVNHSAHFMELNKGECVQIAEEAIVRTANQTLWLKAGSRTVKWLDTELLEGDYFPLATNSSATILGKTEIVAHPTSEWLKIDEQWEGLVHFHKIIYLSIQQKIQNEEIKERERLKKKEENEQLFMSQAVNQITSVTHSKTKTINQVATVSTDPLFLACQLVGEAMGIDVKAISNKVLTTAKNPVENIAKASRFRTRQVVLKGVWWTSDNGPLLAFMEEDGRAVALLQKNSRTYELHDPINQTHVIVTNEVAQKLKPFAYSFYRPLPSKPLNVMDIIKFAGHKSLKNDLIFAILMGVAGGLLGMVTPIATGILFDTILPEAQTNQLLQMTMILFVVSFSILLFEMTRSLTMLRIEGKMNSSIQAAVWDRLLSLPVPFFRDYTAGSLAMRANSINSIRQILSGAVISTVFSGIFSIFNLLLLFYYDIKLALVAFLLVAISIVITVGLGLLQVRYQRRLLAVQGKIAGLVLQILNGIAKFRVTGAENRAFSLWANLFSEQRKIAFASRIISNGLAVFNAVFPILTSMVLYYIVITSDNTAISAGLFLAFFSAFSAFLTAMLGMSSSVLSIANIVPLYENAKPILQAVPEVNEAMEEPGEISGLVEVSHLHFRYSEEQPLVLRDVSLQIKPGEFVALVGSSGCGKSTLFRLLLGFEKPNSGSIYYDGKDLKTVDVSSIRSQLGVVLQNGKVMSGDIFTNIVGSSNLTIDDAWEAARLAGFDDDIRQMPMGMHTVVSEGGGTLSGGQRQRLLIARAIARKPRIIYFDEATSALDNRTQAIVSESLEKLQATRVVIAHRLSTIMNADRIYVLDKGRIVQSGTYEELLHQEGLFAELAKRQMA